MFSLRELQQDFLGDVVGKTNSPIQEKIVPTGVVPEKRLSVYRNNVLANLVDALRLSYPVIERLVGEAFFRQVANKFAREHKSRFYDLNQYGEEFGEFLRDEPSLNHLPYLPDVAKLEWLYQEVYYEADDPPLSLDRLAAIAPEDYTCLRLKLSSCARLFSSTYPVKRIWEANQPDFPGDQTVSLDLGGEKLLIFRRSLLIEFHVLAESDYLFLSACAKGKTLSAAVEIALGNKTTFDLNCALGKYVKEEVLVNFSV